MQCKLQWWFYVYISLKFSLACIDVYKFGPNLQMLVLSDSQILCRSCRQWSCFGVLISSTYLGTTNKLKDLFPFLHVACCKWFLYKKYCIYYSIPLGHWGNENDKRSRIKMCIWEWSFVMFPLITLADTHSNGYYINSTSNLLEVTEIFSDPNSYYLSSVTWAG